ncbi:MAG: hypothetical protein LC808_24045 [Actinobacteria bacterium]|nr:hypothetical protein [Actinomycetota bacterium]
MAERSDGLRGAAAQRGMRVVLDYRGREVRVAGRRVLSLRVPPSDPLIVPERQSGFWFQVEDADGRLLYRKVMANPIRSDTETPSDDPERPLKRVPIPDPRGTFFILVPLLPGAYTVRVFSSPPDATPPARPAEEILRFPVFADVTGEQPPTPEPPPSQAGTAGGPS